jgi:hypothetical protein
MAHLRSSRNISNLQVGTLRYDKSEVPPYGGILAVDTTGKVDITDEVRLRNLSVIDSITVGTTLQVNGALTASSAYVYGPLTAAGDATFLSDVSMGGATDINGPLTVAQNATFLSDVSVNGEIDISGTLTVAQNATFLSDISVNGNINVGNNLTAGNDITAFRVRATYIDSSGIIYGDDVDLSGNLQVDGWSELIGTVTMYGGLQVTGGTTLNNSLYSGGLGTFNAGLQVTGGGTTVSNSLYAGGIATFAAGTSTIGNATVSGTLNAGGLATFAAGTSTTNLFVSGSVGVGTATPTTRLEIYDATNPKIYLTGVGGITGFFSHAGIGIDIGNEGTAIPVRFLPGNIERVRIDGSGNMGVGTTTPATVVQVNNPTQTALTGLAVRSGAVNTTIGNYTGPYNAAANYGSIQTTDAGTGTTIGTSPYPLVLQPLGGRVGIGGAEYDSITNTEKLQVAGNVLVRAGAGITVGTGYSTSYIALNNANAATTNQQTLTVSMDSSGVAILNAAATGIATTPNIVFQTGGVERARVTNSGQVALNVAGDLLGQNIHLTGSSGTTYINGQGAYLSWNNDGFNGQTYLVNQRGIGTGGFRFQIFGSTDTFVKEPLSITNSAVTNGIASTLITQTDIATGATTTNTAALVLQNATGGTHKISFYTNMNGGDYNSLTQAGDKGIIFSNGTVDTGNIVIGPWLSAASGGLRITNTGNVGVGTASPAATLDVVGTSTPADSVEGDPNNFMIGTGKAANDQVLYMGNDASNNLSYIQSVKYGVATAPLLLNARGGNVGIGTTSPSYTLDVSGSVNSNYMRTPDVGITYLSRVNTSLQSLLPIAYVNSPGGSFVLFSLQTSYTAFPTGQIFGGSVVYITLAPQTKITVLQTATTATESYTNATNSWNTGFVSDPGVYMASGIWDSYKLESLI